MLHNLQGVALRIISDPFLMYALVVWAPLDNKVTPAPHECTYIESKRDLDGNPLTPRFFSRDLDGN